MQASSFHALRLLI